jgi:hypothetical protein
MARLVDATGLENGDLWGKIIRAGTVAIFKWINKIFSFVFTIGSIITHDLSAFSYESSGHRPLKRALP